jgi:hypothetical protein
MEGDLTEYYNEEPLVAKIVYSVIPSIDLLTGLELRNSAGCRRQQSKRRIDTNLVLPYALTNSTQIVSTLSTLDKKWHTVVASK